MIPHCLPARSPYKFSSWLSRLEAVHSMDLAHLAVQDLHVQIHHALLEYVEGVK